MSPKLVQCVVLLWIRLIQPIWFASDPLWYSVRITPPCPASSFPLRQDFSKRASFPIVSLEWFYKKDVWCVVKSWEFEGNLRCSKILRIRRKNSMKWVVSIPRDYWVYLDITWQSFKIWEFWGEFWGIETFHRRKFSPATGVRNRDFSPEQNWSGDRRYAGTGSIVGPLFQTHNSKCEFTNKILRSTLLDIQLTLFCVCGVDSFLPELEHL